METAMRIFESGGTAKLASRRLAIRNKQRATRRCRRFRASANFEFDVDVVATSGTSCGNAWPFHP